MSHYAYINPYTKQVEKVLVIDKAQIKSGAFGNPKNFVKCSYTAEFGKVFPGVGYYYVPWSFKTNPEETNVFIPPRPFLSWQFNDKTWTWEPPIEYPNDDSKKYIWNENTKSWDSELSELISIEVRPNKTYILNEYYRWEKWNLYIKRKLILFFKNILT